jgi:hypothetical protein
MCRVMSGPTRGMLLAGQRSKGAVQWREDAHRALDAAVSDVVGTS